MNLRQIDLNLLVALDAMLHERNVTRAGEKLFLSQSAMSGILARLRLMFDDQLLVRVGRTMELTDFAQEIKLPVRQCLQEMEDVLNAHRTFNPQEEHRVFRIAATDYTVMLLLGPLVKQLSEFAPDISVQFVKLDNKALEQLMEGVIDFCIMPHDIETGMPSQELFTDSWVCIVWEEHPHVIDSIDINQFLSEPHMAFNIGDEGHNSLADNFLVKNGFTRRIVATTESFTNAPFLLQGTSMLSMIPRRLAERQQKAAGIRILESPVEVPPLNEQLTWNPRFTKSQAHVWMREQFTNICSGL